MALTNKKFFVPTPKFTGGKMAKKARSNNSFVNRTEVCPHFDYTNIIYGDYKLVAARLGELGIHNIQDASDRQSLFETLDVTSLMYPTAHSG